MKIVRVLAAVGLSLLAVIAIANWDKLSDQTTNSRSTSAAQSTPTTQSLDGWLYEKDLRQAGFDSGTEPQSHTSVLRGVSADVVRGFFDTAQSNELSPFTHPQYQKLTLWTNKDLRGFLVLVQVNEGDTSLVCRPPYEEKWLAKQYLTFPDQVLADAQRQKEFAPGNAKHLFLTGGGSVLCVRVQNLG